MEGKMLLTPLIFVVACMAIGNCLEEGLESKEFYQSVPEETYSGKLISVVDNEDRSTRSLGDDRIFNTIMRSLLHVPQRFGRSPLFSFQPQRFGRDSRGYIGSEGRIHSRGWEVMPSQFWNMAVPQRFGKKK
ncbi:pro-FMRFamide-related neuropeptide FF [Protopterus annectens]|uniref:pro-FMRFamide-related neuropeptide FF n=1 Tax=Protopterus annectens TaxID=7888 RepID=UPI001CFC4199|nr:pro-FMRFamide-related neuropeptide FF [Protopterus annectens]